MGEIPFTFGGLRKPFSDYKTARFAVLPVPYEKTVSYGRGTAKGPKAIIDASRNLELYDEEIDFMPAEAGIATLKPLVVKAAPEAMMAKVCGATSKILSDGKFPVLLGGEHSITPGAVKAVKSHVGEFSVLQFDAHSDLRDSYRGSRFSHACAMARAREHADTVHVGIRSVGDDEADLVKRLRGEGKLFFASDVLGCDRAGDIVSALRENVYITFDVDCFDPSIMPSTGTPEPGGLGWYDVLRILRAVAKERTVVGFDIMELAPNGIKASDFTAARLAYKMMGYTL
jgi:agmatinase